MKVVKNNLATAAMFFTDHARGKTLKLVPGINKVDDDLYLIFKPMIDASPNLDVFDAINDTPTPKPTSTKPVKEEEPVPVPIPSPTPPAEEPEPEEEGEPEEEEIEETRDEGIVRETRKGRKRK